MVKPTILSIRYPLSHLTRFDVVVTCWIGPRNGCQSLKTVDCYEIFEKGFTFLYQDAMSTIIKHIKSEKFAFYHKKRKTLVNYIADNATYVMKTIPISYISNRCRIKIIRMWSHLDNSNFDICVVRLTVVSMVYIGSKFKQAISIITIMIFISHVKFYLEWDQHALTNPLLSHICTAIWTLLIMICWFYCCVVHKSTYVWLVYCVFTFSINT